MLSFLLVFTLFQTIFVCLFVPICSQENSGSLAIQEC